MNKELEDLHGFPPEIPKEISDKVESMMDKLDNIDIHEDLAKNFEDMRNTGNLITLTPPIDGVQYGISDETFKEGVWVYNSHKVEFAPQIYQMPSHPLENEWWDEEELETTKKIICSTNPKDLRFPYLVMPSKEQEVENITQEQAREMWQFCHKQTVDILRGGNDKRLSFEDYIQSLQPTAKAVRVEMEAIYLRTEGEGHSSNSYGIYEDRIKVETSSEYPQGFVKALEVIY